MISIIALLIAILLPALSKARDAARQMKCLANERQIFIAYSCYADDYKGAMPPWNTRLNATTWVRWFEYLVGERRNLNNQTIEKLGTAYLPPKAKTDTDSVLVCPAWDGSLGDVNWASYGANSNRFHSLNEAGEINDGRTWFHRRDIERLGPTIMHYCSAGRKAGGAPDHPEWNHPTNPRHVQLHDSGFPILWFDGHADIQPSDVMLAIDPYW